MNVIALLDPVNAQLVGSRALRRAAAAAGCCSRRSTPTARATARSSCWSSSSRSCCSRSRSCTASTTAACAARRRGTAASPAQTPRMQDTAEGFGQPIRTVFEPFFRMERHLPSPFDAKPALRGRRPRTRSGTGCTCRSRAAAEWLARLVGLHPAGPHLRVPDVQLLHAARAAVLRADDRRRLPLPAAAGRDRARCWRRCSSAGSTSAAPGCRTAARRRCSCPTGRSASCSSRTRSSRRTRRRMFRLDAVHRVRRDDLRGGDRAVARDRPAVRARRRRDRAGRPVRAGAGVHVAGGDGHRHGLRHRSARAARCSSASSPSRRC